MEIFFKYEINKRLMVALIERNRWLENKLAVLDVRLFFQKVIRELHGTSPAVHKTQNPSKTPPSSLCKNITWLLEIPPLTFIVEALATIFQY